MPTCAGALPEVLRFIKRSGAVIRNWRLYCPNGVLMWELYAEQCIGSLFQCIVTFIVTSEYFRSQFEVFCHTRVENSPSFTVCVWCLWLLTLWWPINRVMEPVRLCAPGRESCALDCVSQGILCCQVICIWYRCGSPVKRTLLLTTPCSTFSWSHLFLYISSVKCLTAAICSL